MKNKPGQGRKPGSTKDRAHLNTTISRTNKEWLDNWKKRGLPIAKIIDFLISEAMDK